MISICRLQQAHLTIIQTKPKSASLEDTEFTQVKEIIKSQIFFIREKTVILAKNKEMKSHKSFWKFVEGLIAFSPQSSQAQSIPKSSLVCFNLDMS